MNRSIFFLGFSLLNILAPLAKAELRQIVEPKQWLGYFLAWEKRGWEYGFGADGKASIFLKKGKERIRVQSFPLRCHIQEQHKDQWKRRGVTSWTSDSQGGVEVKKPVSVTLEVKNGAKAKFTHALSNGRIVIRPEWLEGESKNPLRMAVEIDVRDIYKIDKQRQQKPEFNAKDLKKILGKDKFSAKRAKDGKRVKMDLYDEEVDIMSDKMLAEGATELNLFWKKTRKELVLTQGNPKVGKFVIQKRKGRPLYEGYRVLWVVTPEESKKKGAWMSFEVK